MNQGQDRVFHNEQASVVVGRPPQCHLREGVGLGELAPSSARIKLGAGTAAGCRPCAGPTTELPPGTDRDLHRRPVAA